jgi:hypothetical protein
VCVGPLGEADLDEADQIELVAFGTFPKRPNREIPR